MPVATLDQKYDTEQTRVLLSGTQALVRLPLMQRARDRNNGLNTAGYISGYRGSPLGTYDSELVRARQHLQAHDITFVPGINEDLAATAVWGTQQVHTFHGPKVEGVFSIWYGKGPGVDRSGDVMKHANLAGTAPLGGVLAVVGDDHAGKSSTVAHQSEQALAASSIPVLYPANVEEILRFGLLGWAMSRYSGLWVALKCVNETLETTATVDLSQILGNWKIPAASVRQDDVHFGKASQHALAPLADERRLVEQKLPLLQAFVAANGLDRVVIDPTRRQLGIVAAGKAYTDVLHALSLLGLDEAAAGQLGIGLYKPGCVWPLEPYAMRAFARGYRELLFIEEKRGFLEDQAARLLYDLPAASRPSISGKTDPSGTALLPGHGVIDADGVAKAIAQRLLALGLRTAGLERCALALEQRSHRQFEIRVADVKRGPYFCSGCPHNTSTQVPEGAVALGGIGCHGMGVFMGRSLRSTHMGGEGLNWTGIAPFTHTEHVFQNLGDGTYNHSGLLAIHAAVAAGANITYKILYNDAVAMTGGQPVEGNLSVERICAQLQAMGVQRICVVAEFPGRFRRGMLPTGVQLVHRSALDQIQRDLAQVKGVSAMVYDQTCAAEKRRRRKRGLLPQAPARAFINQRVCEGCGDCSVQSNCVSLLPLETELGRKRAIDQGSCNQDLSCIQGFCPSFVSVEGGTLRKETGPAGLDALLQNLPLPESMAQTSSASLLIAGVGGSGVVTIGAVLAMAAHMDGWHASVYDMTGMAQKGGAVLSHVRLSRHAQHATPAIGPEQADVLMACDLLVAGSRDALRTLRADATKVVLNTQLVPTGAFQREPNLDFKAGDTVALIEEAAGKGQVSRLDAAEMARRWLGDAVLANMLLAGHTWQLGLIPLSLQAIEAAIELNGAAVSANLRAFALGRLSACRPEALRPPELPAPESGATQDLEAFIAARAQDLVHYQDERYAQRYLDLVNRVRRRKAVLGLPGNELLWTVARAYYKLLAYKDEYEVARLYTDGQFAKELASRFEGPVRLRFHLAPPLLARRDALSGHLKKAAYGAWVQLGFELLARARKLRGTALDPFGYSEERRSERAAIDRYAARTDELLSGLTAKNHELACRIAEVPLEVRGFGHVKEKSQQAAGRKEAELFRQWLKGLDTQGGAASPMADDLPEPRTPRKQPHVARLPA